MDKRSSLTILEFNSTRLRVCRSVPSKDKRRITHCFSLEVPGALEKLPGILASEFKQRRMKPDPVVLSLSRDKAVARLLRLPSRDEVEIRNMVSLQIKREAGYQDGTANDLIYDYRVTGFDREGYALVSLFVLRKKQVEAYLDILRGTGIYPEAVTLSTQGLANWSRLRHPSPDNKSRGVVLLNADRSHYEVDVVIEGDPVFSRSFEVAEKLPPEQAAACINREVKLSLDLFNRLARRPDGDAPLTLLPQSAAAFASVLGLALNPQERSIDVMLPELKAFHHRKHRLWFWRRIWLAAILVHFGAAVFFIRTLDVHGRAFDRARQQLAQIEPIEQKIWEGVARSHAGGDVFRGHSVGEIAEALLRLVQEPIFLMRLELRDDATVSVSGTSSEAGAVFALIDLLERSPFFRNVRLDFINAKAGSGAIAMPFRLVGEVQGSDGYLR